MATGIEFVLFSLLWVYVLDHVRTYHTLCIYGSSLVGSDTTGTTVLILLPTTYLLRTSSTFLPLPTTTSTVPTTTYYYLLIPTTTYSRVPTLALSKRERVSYRTTYYRITYYYLLLRYLVLTTTTSWCYNIKGGIQNCVAKVTRRKKRNKRKISIIL